MNHKLLGAAAALLAGLAGCGPAGDAPGPSAGAPASAASPAGGGSPVSVSTVRAQQRDVDVQVETTGTVTSLNAVDVKPQVASTIAQVHFREGQFVKAGQLLFTLDSRAAAADLARVRAQLQRDLAALAD
ncbi:MAG TPA: biotin/lipoyl-binding protein, partial [Albitalea sp.]